MTRYFVKKDVDLEVLKERYFFSPHLVRGKGFGWSHYVDVKTREIKWTDPYYTALFNDYEELGGLKTYIFDLIQQKLVDIK